MKKPFSYLFVCFLSLAFINTVTAQKSPAINHLALSVTDLKRSVNFYSDIIGLDSIPEPFKDGRHAWFSIGENISLHLIEDAPATKTYYKNSHLCLSTANLASFIERLKQRGVEFENVKGTKGEFTTRVDGVKQIYFRDPDGYWIEMNDAAK
jgi:lactoylglutathione lyase